MTPSETPHPLPSRLSAFFWHFVRPRKWAFLLLLILPFSWSLEQNLFPYVIKMIVDIISTYSGPKDEIFSALRAPFLLGGAVWVISVAMWRFVDMLDARCLPDFQADIRIQAVRYVERHSHRYFSDHFTGSIANKISDLPASMQQIWLVATRNFLPTGVSALIAMGLLWRVSPLISALFFCWFWVHLGMSWRLSLGSQRLAHIHSEMRSALQGKIVDSLSNMSNVRLFARQEDELRYIGTHQAREKRWLRRLLWQLFRVKLLLEIPSALLMVAVMYLLIRGWQAGSITTGDTVLVLSLVLGLMMAIWRMSLELPGFFREVGICNQALSIIARPHEMTDAPDAAPLRVTSGAIAFENVHFHYIAGRDIFRDKNIAIAAGQKVGLVGFSGSGKSTFVHLLLRYYDVESGVIAIDGQNIARVTMDSLHRSIAMIPQDTTLFHRSLLENIRYGRLDASDDEIIQAAQKADCHDFIMQMPQGYATLVGERGVKLSGGQRQRIAIARAILKNAPILILDEATSSLDSVTERAIQHSLAELMRGRTVIVIAHRLSTLVHMDRVLVFKEGTIAEDGSHQELLDANGHYALLWRMQADGFLPDAPV